jgi:hypothetical protein
MRAAPAFGRADQSGIHQLEHSALAECMQDPWMRRHSSPAMGMSGISNSQVSRLCPKVDDKVKAFPGRSDRGRLAVSAG